MYTIQKLAREMLQLREGVPSSFQQIQLKINRRFLLSTEDPSHKKNARLTRDAMPVPLSFVAGVYKVDGG